MKLHSYALTAALSVTIAGCGSTPMRPVSGEQTFETHCAACHGSGGAGDGPVAATLRTPAPDLRALCERAGGEFPTDRVASYIDGRVMPAAHGARSMPVWGPVFETTYELVKDAETPEQRIDAVISHLRAIQSRCDGTG